MKTQKDHQIAEILSNSAYLPKSEVYKGAKAALERLSAVAIGQICAVIICKTIPKDT